jgi:hypothetical protein
MSALPLDGDCGRDNVADCPRYIYASNDDPKVHEDINKTFGHNVTNAYTDEVAINGDELKILFPLLPNNNNRPPRRLTGGGNR